MARLTTVKTTRERNLAQLVDPKVWERNHLGTAVSPGISNAVGDSLVKRPGAPCAQPAQLLTGLARFLRRRARRTTFLSADLYAVEVSCWGQDGRSGHSDCKR